MTTEGNRTHSSRGPTAPEVTADPVGDSRVAASAALNAPCCTGSCRCTGAVPAGPGPWRQMPLAAGGTQAEHQEVEVGVALVTEKVERLRRQVRNELRSPDVDNVHAVPSG